MAGCARRGLRDAQGWSAFTGQPMEKALDRGWYAMVHPEDLPQLRDVWSLALEEAAPVDVEHRVRTAGGSWRWCRARGVPVPPVDPAAADQRPEWVGVLEDVDDRRRAEERRLLIAREVDHRAKNVLAVVNTILHLTRADDPKDYTRAVVDRVAALARAHDLLAEGGWQGADLRAVVEREFAAFPRGALIAEGEALPLSALAVQPIGMVLHELATNAAKAGALSRPEGRVRLAWRAEAGTLRLRWAEEAGPAISGPPPRQGFGVRMVDSTIRRQLGGSIARHWEASGLVVEIGLPADRVLSAEAIPSPDRDRSAA
ncbi:HWE histidine kinase domain-containing protein [Roseomonas sp. CCTCC AB2023176]|uniref:HWE histidine kinase domain-containing protein n=1 Tax=Roseomonas sp. CCTCC AB2023176 TaxID=3342640 RepID=UPI0035DCB7A1